MYERSEGLSGNSSGASLKLWPESALYFSTSVMKLLLDSTAVCGASEKTSVPGSRRESNSTPSRLSTVGRISTLQQGSSQTIGSSSPPHHMMQVEWKRSKFRSGDLPRIETAVASLR